MHVPVSDSLTIAQQWLSLCGLFARDGARYILLPFIYGQTTCGLKKKKKVNVYATRTVYKSGKQSGCGEKRRLTLDIASLWQICQPHLTVCHRACLALVGFTAVAVLHTPCYISHYNSNTPPPRAFGRAQGCGIYFSQIHGARGVRDGDRWELLKTDGG